MEKRNMFDLLEDSDEGELAMIDRLTPELSEEQFERILEMSKRNAINIDTIFAIHFIFSILLSHSRPITASISFFFYPNIWR